MGLDSHTQYPHATTALLVSHENPWLESISSKWITFLKLSRVSSLCSGHVTVGGSSAHAELDHSECNAHGTLACSTLSQPVRVCSIHEACKGHGTVACHPTSCLDLRSVHNGSSRHGTLPNPAAPQSEGLRSLYNSYTSKGTFTFHTVLQSTGCAAAK